MTDPPQTPTRLRRLRALFEQALDLGEPERATFVAGVAGEDPTLAAELDGLLRAHDSTGMHLNSPIAGDLLRTIGSGEADWQGTRVGVYAIGDRIGAGGMGTVHQAVRADDQFKKQVAIKFLRRGVESEMAIRRFRYERQILANLNHRNIAALLDGGVTDDGQPYFVMELVEGQPITTWCDARKLDISGRVQLFRQVCGAVQHAHQNLVVHRDLKPGNILVTDDGTVKLLDFGIAKLLREDEGSDQLPPTQGGPRAFTPDYASPEQVRGLPVGTTSDVYALGVVLFELLTGRRPFELAGHLFAEIESIVSTRPPPRPSTVITAERPALTGERSIAALRSRISGDLDAIILTALRKEPERRYGSADQLNRDLALHLDGMPVTARPEGLGYRFGKLLRRRRLELAATTLAVVSLVAGIVATSRQAQRAEAERERATEITEFLTAMLAAPNPDGLGRDVTMREVLDSAVVRADSLQSRPGLEYDVRSVIAITYLGLGEYDAAVEEYRRALDAARRADPDGGSRVAMALSRLGTGLEYTGDYEAADSMVAAALAELERSGRGHEAEAVDWVEQRGRLRQRLGDSHGAATLLAQVVELQREINPDNDSALAVAHHNLAVALGDLGRSEEADSLFRSALALERNAFGEEHPLVASSTSAHASILEELGQNEAADSAYRRALSMREVLLGNEHPDYAWSMFNYADFLLRRERWAEAAHWGRRVVALREVLPESHMAVSTGMQVLGRALARLDSLPEAERLLRESLAVRKATFPGGHWVISSSESVLGEFFTLAGRYQEAEAILLSSEQRLVELRGAEGFATQTTRKRLVDLYTAWNKPAQARLWQDRLTPTL